MSRPKWSEKVEKHRESAALRTPPCTRWSPHRLAGLLPALSTNSAHVAECRQQAGELHRPNRGSQELAQVSRRRTSGEAHRMFTGLVCSPRRQPDGIWPSPYDHVKTSGGPRLAVRLQPATRAIHVLSESRDTRSAALAAEGVSRGSQACRPTQDDARQRAAPSGRHGKSVGASVSRSCSSSRTRSSFEQLQPLGLAA